VRLALEASGAVTPPIYLVHIKSWLTENGKSALLPN